MTPPVVMALVAAPIGACVGSFVATAVVRQGRGEQVLRGRSRCDHCHRELSFFDSAFIVSYAAARGACRACGGRIDPLHLAGELGGAAVTTAALLYPIKGAELVRPLIATLGLLLLALALHDARTLRIPNALNAGVLAASSALAASKGLDGLIIGGFSGLVVYALLSSVAAVYQGCRGRNGLGVGDIKLLTALAVALGPGLSWVVAIASVLALGWSLVTSNVRSPVPFGPFIAVAAFAVCLVQLGGGTAG